MYSVTNGVDHIKLVLQNSMAQLCLYSRFQSKNCDMATVSYFFAVGTNFFAGHLARRNHLLAPFVV